MSSEDGFWGADAAGPGRRRSAAAAAARSDSPLSHSGASTASGGERADGRQSDDERESPQSAASDASAPRAHSEAGGGSEPLCPTSAGAGGDASTASNGSGDADATESDPLSDIFDSADEHAVQCNESGPSGGGGGAASAQSPHHAAAMQSDMVEVTLGDGTCKLVDMTPPDRALEHAVNRRDIMYESRAHMRRECLSQAVAALALTKIICGKSAWSEARASYAIAECEAHIARIYWELFEYGPQTYEHAHEAYCFLEDYTEAMKVDKTFAKPVEFKRTQLMAHYYLGKGLTATKQPQKARRMFEQALSLLNADMDAIDGQNSHSASFWQCEISCGAAYACKIVGDNESAIRYLDDAMEIVKSAYGSHSTRLLPVLQQLAAHHEALGSFDVAADTRKEAVDIVTAAAASPCGNAAEGRAKLSKAEKRRHARDLASTMHKLAHTYRLAIESATVGSDDKAQYAVDMERQHSLARHMLTKAFGSASTPALNANLLHARALGADEHRRQEAAALYSSTADDCARHYGPYDERTAGALNELAELRLAMCDTAGARLAFGRLAKIERCTLGPNHANTRRTMAALAMLHTATN